MGSTMAVSSPHSPSKKSHISGKDFHDALKIKFFDEKKQDFKQDFKHGRSRAEHK